jgi:hypothetical protein
LVLLFACSTRSGGLLFDQLNEALTVVTFSTLARQFLHVLLLAYKSLTTALSQEKLRRPVDPHSTRFFSLSRGHATPYEQGSQYGHTC